MKLLSVFAFMSSLLLALQFTGIAHAASDTKISSKSKAPKGVVTILRVPVFIETPANETTPAAELNKALVKAHAKEIPDYFEFSSADSQDVTTRKFERVNRQINAATKLIGKEWTDTSMIFDLFPAQNSIGNLETCYKGDANAVPGNVEMLAGLYYT